MKSYLIVLLVGAIGYENRLQAMYQERQKLILKQIKELDEVIARNEQAARNPGQCPPFIVWMLDERNRKQPVEKQEESTVK